MIYYFLNVTWLLLFPGLFLILSLIHLYIVNKNKKTDTIQYNIFWSFKEQETYTKYYNTDSPIHKHIMKSFEEKEKKNDK